MESYAVSSDHCLGNDIKGVYIMTDGEKDALNKLLADEEYFDSLVRWNRFWNYLRFLAGVIVGVLIMYIAQL